MEIILTTFFFMFGMAVASFVGVVTGRLYTGQGITLGRSRCDACGRVLGPGALLPVFSFVFQGGRAHCCGARLSALAPASELILGALFAASYLQLGMMRTLPLLLLALTLLGALVLYDLAHQILPPILLAAFVIVSAMTGFFASPDASALHLSLIIALSFGIFFALLWTFSRGRAMGLADAPLVAGLALLTGPAAPIGFLLSFWIGALVGIVLLATRAPGARMGVEVPFAPFLAAGFLLAYFTQWDPFALYASLTALQ